MSTISRLFTAALATAAIALPTLAAAGEVTALCSVSVDYLRNGVVANTYRQDFSVTEGTPYLDDFSSAIRIRQFGASVGRVGSDTVVSVDYFNDVGTFVSISFNTSLVLRGGSSAGQSTSGSHSTYASSVAGPLNGTTTTNYQLSCRRV